MGPPRPEDGRRHSGYTAGQSREGKTELAGIDAASRKAVQEHLYSPGELLRMDQLRADDRDVERQQQVELFTGLPDDEATAAMDLALCRTGSPSFDKLCRELERRLRVG